jgi:hypothetical protein
MDRNEVVSILGVGKSTLAMMIKKGIIEDGKQILARTKMWRVEDVKGVAERLHNGEFSGVRLWSKKP